MKTLAQLGSGIQPVGTARYFGDLQQLLTVNCNVKNGELSLDSHPYRNTCLNIVNNSER